MSQVAWWFEKVQALELHWAMGGPYEAIPIELSDRQLASLDTTFRMNAECDIRLDVPGHEGSPILAVLHSCDYFPEHMGKPICIGLKLDATGWIDSRPIPPTELAKITPEIDFKQAAEYIASKAQRPEDWEGKANTYSLRYFAKETPHASQHPEPTP